MQTSGAYARHLLHRSWDATCDNPVCVKVSGPGALCEYVVAGTQFDNMRRTARARRGGGRPTMRGLGREARRARSVALLEAVQGGVWDADAVANVRTATTTPNSHSAIVAE